MDRRDLKSASTYVNNLLASRGLLRGHAIPFHKPGEDDVPAKIINLVHELIARRDRESDQREDLALTLRTLRSTEVKQTDTIEQLKEKNRELERKNAILESQSRSFNVTLRNVEASANALRHEAARAKTLLAQVRTQCANDIRKRDVQIQKMKERLADPKRGTKSAMAHISIVGGGSGGSRVSGEEELAGSSSLGQDTTDFLTTLSQGLADENDNLIALIRQTLSTLKIIQGLPDDGSFPAMGEQAEDAENPVIAPPASFDALSDSLEEVLYSLREVLNQPNYVPLEELEDRDAEIVRLKQRNETLEEEWRKALELVEGWNKTLGRNLVGNAGSCAEADGVVAKERKKRKGKERALKDVANGSRSHPSEDVADKDTAQEREKGDESMDDVHLVEVIDPPAAAAAEPARRRSLRNKGKATHNKPQPKLSPTSPKPSSVHKKRKTRKTRSCTPQELEDLVAAV